MRLLIALALGLILLGGALPAMAQSPTHTPTPSNTPTLTSNQRAALATIVPPPNCGAPYNPCRALPWSVPKFPTVVLPSPTIQATLPSPTPIPLTSTASPTPTGANTATPAPTSTLIVDVGGLSSLNSTMSAMQQTLSAQSTQTILLNGTAVGPGETAQQLGQNVGNFFGFIRAISTLSLGPVGGLITFGLLALAFVFFVYVATFAMPIIMWIVNLILRVITAFKPL